MIVRVHLLPFGRPGEVREVEVPPASWERADSLLERLGLVFHYGQNDFQPKPHPSVSVGDVVEFPEGGLHVVQPYGFGAITPEQFEELKATEHHYLSFHPLVRPDR